MRPWSSKEIVYVSWLNPRDRMGRRAFSILADKSIRAECLDTVPLDSAGGPELSVLGR